MIKKFVLNNCMKSISKKYPYYSEIQLSEIKYGLEGIYLTFTKLIIILIIAFILGIVKEVLITILFYNLIRSTGYGIHASKSWICLLASIVCFTFLPLLLINFNLNFYIKLFISIISLIVFWKYAPADTKKHPLIKKKKRMIFKYSTIFTNIIYIILIIIYRNSFITNSITIALIVESILVLPITYSIFNTPYANYKSYLTAN